MPGFRPVVCLLAILPALLFAITDMDFLPQKGAVGLFRVPKQAGMPACFIIPGYLYECVNLSIKA